MKKPSGNKPVKKIENVNIGHLSNKQLKDKLEKIEVKTEIKAKK